MSGIGDLYAISHYFNPELWIFCAQLLCVVLGHGKRKCCHVSKRLLSSRDQPGLASIQPAAKRAGPGGVLLELLGIGVYKIDHERRGSRVRDGIPHRRTINKNQVVVSFAQSLAYFSIQFARVEKSEGKRPIGEEVTGGPQESDRPFQDLHINASANTLENLLIFGRFL